DFGPRIGRCQHVTAAHVDVVGESERDRLPGRRLIEIAGRRNNACNLDRPAGWKERKAVARAHASRHDGAAIAAELRARPVDPLHWHAEWLAVRARRYFDAFEMFEEGCAAIPLHRI